jgi:quinol monooxygenase YgiN
MVHVLIRHRVSDFEKWKAAFHAAFMFRKSAGEQSFHLYHDANDPSDLTLLFEWESAALAEKFLKSEKLKEEMRHAGVQEPVEARIMQEVVAMRRTAAD